MGTKRNMKKNNNLVADEHAARTQIEKARNGNVTRVFVLGWISKELQEELKAEGCRILKMQYASLKYTSISW